MKPVQATLHTRRGDLAIDIDPDGYSRFPRIGSGFRVFGENLLWINGEVGAGVIQFDALSIRYDSPLPLTLLRTGWAASGDTLTIGRGSEAIAPRAMLPIRLGYSATAIAGIGYGPRTVRWAATQRRDIFLPLLDYLAQERSTGLWAPIGAKQAAPPGADDRATVPGYEQNGPGFLLKADLIAERMAVACVDSVHGEPLAVRDDGYAAGRGWSGAGQHKAFESSAWISWIPFVKPWKTTVSGDCPYVSQMCGEARDSGWGPFDPEHTGNALSHWIAAMNCGDAMANFYIRLLANDLAMATGPYGIPRMARGGRAFAWTIATLWHTREHRWDALRMIDELVAHGPMRAPASYPFSPTPQSFGMPWDADSEQLMEGCLSAHAAYLDGHIDYVRKWLLNSPAPLQFKFVQRGRNQTEVFDHYEYPCGNGDYFFPAVPYGICLLHDPHDAEIMALAMATYGATTPVQLRDILRARTIGREQDAVLLSVLEGIT